MLLRPTVTKQNHNGRYYFDKRRRANRSLAKGITLNKRGCRNKTKSNNNLTITITSNNNNNSKKIKVATTITDQNVTKSVFKREFIF